MIIILHWGASKQDYGEGKARVEYLVENLLHNSKLKLHKRKD